MLNLRVCVAVAALLGSTAAAPPERDTPAARRSVSGTLPDGARWAAQVPSQWNGTLLLWSRGYSPKAGDPELAPPPVRDALLAQGYAIAASNYGADGWALAEAIPGARYVELADARHAVTIQQADAINALLLQHFSSRP